METTTEGRTLWYVLSIIQDGNWPDHFQDRGKEIRPLNESERDSYIHAHAHAAKDIHVFHASLKDPTEMRCGLCRHVSVDSHFVVTLTPMSHITLVMTWLFPHCSSVSCVGRLMELAQVAPEERFRHLLRGHDKERELIVSPGSKSFDLRPCANEECHRMQGVDEDKFGRCSGCRMVYYCSTECARKSWHAGHKAYCKRYQRPKEVKEREQGRVEADILVLPNMGEGVVHCTLPTTTYRGDPSSSLFLDMVHMDVNAHVAKASDRLPRPFPCAVCDRATRKLRWPMAIVVTRPQERQSPSVVAGAMLVCESDTCYAQAEETLRALQAGATPSVPMIHQCKVCHRIPVVPLLCPTCKRRAYCDETCRNKDKEHVKSCQ